jgi:CRP-like cAMP-binding protein
MRQSTFQMVWEGSVVGEAEAVTGSPYRYTMVTETDCQLLYIHRFTCTSRLALSYSCPPSPPPPRCFLSTQRREL